MRVSVPVITGINTKNLFCFILRDPRKSCLISCINMQVIKENPSCRFSNALIILSDGFGPVIPVNNGEIVTASKIDLAGFYRFKTEVVAKTSVIFLSAFGKGGDGKLF